MTENNHQRKAGKARAQSMTQSERKALAAKAAHARWAKRKDAVLQATHEGQWKLGSLVLSCAVLEDGRRVFSDRSLSDAFSHVRSGAEFKRRNELPPSEQLPVVVSPTIAEYLSDEAKSRLSQVIWYRTNSGNFAVPARGIEADLLPELCDAFLAAREDGALKSEASLRKAAAAERLLRALAKVGVVAIVDEVTGYQIERDKAELQKLLEQYVTEPFRPWTQVFPTEFYRQIFRLRGITTDDVRRRPAYFGKLTNDIVYERLLPGMVEKLCEVNPVNESGRRSRRHHQHLSDNVGVKHLHDHLVGVLMLMRAASDWRGFMRALDKACPKPSQERQKRLT